MRMSSTPRLVLVLALSTLAAACGPTSTTPAGATAGATTPAGATAGATAAGGGGASGGAIAVGGDLCGLLGPGDFTAAGIPGAGVPSENNTPPTDYYCAYAGTSSATGGIELDAFVVAPADADGVLDTVLSETGIVIRTDRGAEVGADRAVLATDVSGDKGKVAIIAVRKGALVFDIGFPSGPDAERQLIDLAKLVISRAVAQIG